MTLMKVSTFLKRVNYALRGTDDEVPDPTDEDGKYWIETLNRKKDEAHEDTSKNWRSDYKDDTKIGDISASERLSIDLPDDFLAPADNAYAIDTNGQYHYFTVVDPSERDTRVQAVSISGSSPQKLTFSAAIEPGSVLIDGELFLPGYYLPADLDPASEDIANKYVPLPDANWGVMAVAAQIAFNDITYEDKFGDLNGQAGVLWKLMVRNNRKRGRGNPKVATYSIKRIRGVR